MQVKEWKEGKKLSGGGNEVVAFHHVSVRDDTRKMVAT